MTKVFSCDVWRLDVPSVHNQSGELVEVSGERMVRLAHGAIVPLRREDEWHPSPASAKRVAASRVEAMIVQMHGLAARLRAEADAEENRNA